MMIVFALIVILVVIIIICLYRNKSEKFTWANAVQTYPGTYDLSPNDYQILDDGKNANYFANVVAPATPEYESFTPQYPDSKSMSDLPLPVRPFDTQYDPKMLLPSDAESVTMYDRDVSDPAVYLFRSSNRAQIKNRQQMTSDPLRGDIAITPYRTGWFDSRYSEGDSKLDGYFSAYTNAKYAMLTGQKSYPANVVNEGLIMDYSGSTQPDSVMGYY